MVGLTSDIHGPGTTSDACYSRGGALCDVAVDKSVCGQHEWRRHHCLCKTIVHLHIWPAIIAKLNRHSASLQSDNLFDFVSEFNASVFAIYCTALALLVKYLPVVLQSSPEASAVSKQQRQSEKCHVFSDRKFQG